MGKSRTRKPYTSVDVRKQKERLMEDHEIYTEQELKELKRRRGMQMKMRDREIEQEQDTINNLGTCPFCYSVLTLRGECMASCR